jgi:hypothetical protein
MPAIDEDILRELMLRSTDDLHAPSAVTADIVTRHRRRHRRGRVLSVAVTGVAAGAAVGVVVAASGNSPAAPSSASARHGARMPVVRLTAAQHALYRLSSVAAAARQPQGRYAVLSERQDNYEKTSVIDSRTGDVWTYQHGAGVPGELPVARHFSPTEAAFDAMPTDPAALRAALIAAANQQAAQARKQLAAELKKRGKQGVKILPSSAPRQSASDKVFEQATDMLWNPLVSPSLRSALLKVLATTPGVVVDKDASDGIGRPAVKISRFDSAADETTATFESPTTGRVLESAYTQDGGGVSGTSSQTSSDLYRSVTRTDTRPANPYQS